MKRYLLPYGALFIILALPSLTGCTPDNPSPSPADPRETFVGTWGVNESGQKLTYQVNIALDPTSDTQVLIYNFAGSGSSSAPAVAVVSGNTINLVPNDVIADGWVINGGGVLSGSNTINWAYTVNAGGDLRNLTAVYTRI